MAEQYEISAIDPGKEPFKDQNGNTWVTAAFVGVSEPVKWVVKDPSKFKVGDTVYGEIKDMQSKAGRAYRRFYKQQPPEPTYKATEQSDEYWKERNDSIKAQFAIKTAVELLKNPDATDISEDLIERWASIFFNMVERIPVKPKEAVNLDEVDL